MVLTENRHFELGFVEFGFWVWTQTKIMVLPKTKPPKKIFLGIDQNKTRVFCVLKNIYL